MRMAAVPSRTMYRPDPLSPWRRTFSPSANHCSANTSTTFSRCGVVRSAKRANPAIVSASSPTATSCLSDHLVVCEAVQPPFAGLERPDDGMGVATEVSPRVPVYRIVAAADVAAGHAEPQVHPLASGRQAFRAAVRGARRNVADHAQVPACHCAIMMTLTRTSGGSGPDLLLAPCVERVVHRHLRLQLVVVMVAVGAAEPHRDSAEARGFSRLADIRVDIGAVHDSGHAVECGVVQTVLDQDRLKRAPAVDIAKLDSLDVEWHSI